MSALLWISRAAGWVPGWCWAAVVVVLSVLCARLDVGMAHARTDAAQARAQLLAVQLASRDAIAAETEHAQARVRDLTKFVLESQDALAQSRQAGPGRVAALDERLRQLARPLACGGAGSTPGAGVAAVARGGDGRPGAGLPGLAAGDFVVLDGQGLAELASFADSAADTGRALIEARKLLRSCWRSP